MSRLISEHKHIDINRFIALIIAAVVFLGTFILGAGSVNADAELAYEITKYEKDTVVFEDHSYKVNVKIEVRIPEDTRTLDIALPSGNFQVDQVMVDGDAANVSSGSYGRKLTISNPKKLKKGRHTFNVTYEIKEYAERIEEYDIFYYDALLPEWKVPIGELAINVQFPKNFPWDDMQYYAGQFGLQSSSTKLNYKADEATKTVTITGKRIPENFSITIKDQLPDGYWQNALDHTWTGYMIAGLLLGVFAFIFVLWMIGGRDPRVAKTTEMYPIEGVLPSDITYIYEGKVRIRDIVALIIYMGTKGYLKISEYAPRKYRLVRAAEPKGEERFIRNIYNTLFEGVYENRSIDMDEIGPRLRRVLKQAVYDVEAGYADKSMASMTTRSRVFRVISIVLSSLAIAAIPILTNIYQYIAVTYTQPILFGVLAALALISVCRRVDSKYDVDDAHYYVGITLSLLAYGFAVGFPLFNFVRVSGMYSVGIAALVLAFVNVFFCAIMPARGKGNAELTMRLNQLRKFIYRTKRTDVEDIYRADPEYYYDMLPFALVFSGIESWAKTFNYLDVDEPSWYSDDLEGHAESAIRSTRGTIEYARDIRSFARTMEDSYNAMMLHNRRRQRKR